MNKTRIQYADYSWNYFTGCMENPIRPGCANCWARKTANRLKGRFGYHNQNPFKPTIHRDELYEPLRVKKPSRILVNFMGDMFLSHTNYYLTILNHLIDIANEASQHTYLVLTKYVDNAMALFSSTHKTIEHDNIWFGITCENYGIYNRDVVKLDMIPIRNKWVSFEPLLSPIFLDDYADKHFDWCVIGGETGPTSREVKLSWMIKLMLDCQRYEIPVFFKQFGKEFDDNLGYLSENGKYTRRMENYLSNQFARILPF